MKQDKPELNEAEDFALEGKTASVEHPAPEQMDVTKGVSHDAPTTPPAVTPVEMVSTDQPTPPPLAAALEPTAPATNNPITIILQWLTYASWGWFALAMVWLSTFVVSYFLLGAQSQEEWSQIIAYPVAAAGVLFAVAAVLDFCYGRREPVHKEGFSMAVMVIHVVIFALCGIGALVVAVFSLLNMVLSGGLNVSTGSQATTITFATSLLLLVIYVILVARTAVGVRIKRLPLYVTMALGILMLCYIIAAIVGPVGQSVTTARDRQIETAVPIVSQAIRSYVQTNDKLPASLEAIRTTSSVTASEPTVRSLDQYLIRYTPNSSPATASRDASLHTDFPKSTGKLYYYRLCVTYDAVKNGGSRVTPMVDPAYGGTVDSYYIDTTHHDKGEQCYDQIADYYESPKTPQSTN